MGDRGLPGFGGVAQCDILQVIMRNTIVFLALLGVVCLLAAGQAAPARQQPKAQPHLLRRRHSHHRTKN